MNNLIISISGIRGIVGESFNPDIITKFAMAFGTYIKGKKRIIIGRDTRITGEMVKNCVISGLLATGCEVTDIGIAPTPTVQFLVRSLNFDGSIVISASHNPIQWNALKLYKKSGLLFEKSDNQKFMKIFKSEKFALVPWNKYKKVLYKPELVELHIKQVLKSLKNINKIKKKKFKIALDSCNASGSFITQDLLKKLNCNVKGLYVTPDGYFPRNPEPNTRNLKDIIKFMQKGCYNIGFAQDSDADRLAVLDENGNFLSEEYTVALATYYVLSIYDKTPKLKNRYTKSVVINLSTSRMVEDVAKKFNAKVYRTPVGEINVARKMLKTKSVIGGEGNGGVIFPEVNYGRDSLAGIGLILELLATADLPLSKILSQIPSYVMLKTKFNVENLNLQKILNKIEKDFPDAKINKDDGIRCDFNDFWFHIRCSNTEPIVRLIIEANNRKILNETVKKLKKYFVYNNV